MAKSERGTKRLCQECEVKFYDLNKDPIICPACGEIFTFEEKAPEPKPKDADKPPNKEEAKDVTDNSSPEIISLDDAEDEADGENIPDVDDVEVDDNVNADQQDTFLEEDDDDANINLGVPTNTDDE